jgi:soluble lytic murein transglycosylase-like protein
MKCIVILALLPCASAQARAGCGTAYRCVQHYAAHYHVPPDFVAALIDVESGWNPRAVSQKGAMGLMQLMPATARRFGAFDPFNAEQNIAAGTRYITALRWEFHGDLRLVSAAYYAGDRGIALEQLNYRNPDVLAYVQEVRRRYMLRKNPIANPSRRSFP